MKTILYFTDALGITEGYRPIYQRMLKAVEIPPQAIQICNISKVIEDALSQKGNQLEKTINLDHVQAITEYVDRMIQLVKPDLIVTSCGAALAVLNQQTWGADKVGKTRGSLYHYCGIDVVVVPPISSIHRQEKAKVIDSELTDNPDVYKIKDGHWFWIRDWAKVGRFYAGKTRQFPPFVYSVLRNVYDIPKVIEYLKGCVLISSDIETSGSHEAGGYTISCVGYTGLHRDGGIHTFIIPFADKFQYNGVVWQSEEEMQQAFEAMQTINALPIPKVYQNGSYDNAYNIAWRCPASHYFLDTMHMWHSLYPELDKSLDVIASVFLDQYTYWKQDLKGLKEEKGRRRDKDMETFWRYNALDCYYTLCTSLQLLRLINANESIKFNYRQEFMQMLAGLSMTLRGLKVDFTKREELREELEQKYQTNLSQFCHMIDDPEFNVNSPKQKNELLYDLLGATPRNAAGKLAKGKGRSTGKLALRMIATEHPFYGRVVNAMQEVMEPKTQISNVCDVVIATHRMRSSISVRTETWRYSSSSSPFWDGTNMQNIRKSMRKFLVADDGMILFDVDYSQSDAVFVAYEADDANYIATMSSGKDSHAVHGAFFFKRPYEEIVKGKKANLPEIVHPITGIRNVTKRIVHGANFQMSGSTLYVNMGKEATIATAKYLGHADSHTWTEETFMAFCQRLLNQFRALYPRLSKKGWYGEIAQQLKDSRTITNAFGMTRAFIGSPTDPMTQREATAFYGQSDTAGNMNRTLNEIQFGFIPAAFRDGPNPCAREKPLRLLQDKDFGMEMCLQVHDSFIGQINTRAPRWKEALHNLLIVMERPVIIKGHSMCVKAEAEIGIQWGKDMTPWKRGDPYDLDRLGVVQA